MGKEIKAFLKRKDFKASVLLSTSIIVAALVKFEQWEPLLLIAMAIAAGMLLYGNIKDLEA